MTSSTSSRAAARRAPRPQNRPAKAVPAPAYAVGDIYLAALPELNEVEIEDVVPAAQVIKIKGRGWIERHAFEQAVKARLGRAVYSSGLLGPQRKFIRET